MTKTNTTISLNCNPDCLRYHGGPDHSETCPLYDLPQCPCRAEMIDGPHDRICYDSGWIAQANRAASQLAMRRQPQEEQQNQQQGRRERFWQCRHCGKTGITTQIDKTECAQGCPPNGKSGAACSIRKEL